ncbi:MAG: tetratricopeptide repeat protein [Bacteroidota bacterium]|nr:tetratricopeptide repeat protein [Bacteroidota bacterium]
MHVKLKNIIKEHLIIIIALTVTALVYFKFLFYNHISWDDPEMVFKNRAVQSFDIKALFSNHYVGNYIPITMLMHAIAWLFFENNDWGHHLINILFHLLNGVLVYSVTNKLFKQNWLANLTCIVFLLHPLQIESVGWISELKTILSATFFLLALLYYLKYNEFRRQKFYLIALFLFCLGSLCKSSAVILPLVLLLVDVFNNKTFSFKFLINKIPLFIISLIIGLITIKAQTADLFINHSHEFPYYQRIGLAGYAMLKYFSLFLFPVKLSVIYSYPEIKTPILIIGYSILLLLAGSIFYFIKLKKYNFLFISSFIFLNLILVLQLLPFGEALYADRYAYLPIIGFAWALSFIVNVIKTNKVIIYALVILIFSAFTFNRISKWQSATSLYEDILKNYPNQFIALNSLGVEYMFANNNLKALDYFNKAATVAPNNYKGFYNRGLLFLKMNKPELAIKSFNQSLNLYLYSKALVGRASAYYALNDLSKAIKDVNLALSLEKNNAKAYFVLGNCYNDLNKLNEAIAAYNNSIDLINDEPDFYFKRAIAQGKKQNFDACISDISVCINMKPNYYEAYYWRGVAKVNLKKSPCEDFKFAAQNNFEPAINALNKYCR